MLFRGDERNKAFLYPWASKKKTAIFFSAQSYLIKASSIGQQGKGWGLSRHRRRKEEPDKRPFSEDYKAEGLRERGGRENGSSSHGGKKTHFRIVMERAPAPFLTQHIKRASRRKGRERGGEGKKEKIVLPIKGKIRSALVVRKRCARIAQGGGETVVTGWRFRVLIERRGARPASVCHCLRNNPGGGKKKGRKEGGALWPLKTLPESITSSLLKFSPCRERGGGGS